MTAQHPSDATVQPRVVDASAGRRVQAGPLTMRIIEDGSHTSGTHAVLEFTLNGQLMQDSSTSAMIHDVYELVSYASHITTLRPGDVIATGTPPGVGSGRTPPVFLKAGDVGVCTYEGIGTLRNPLRTKSLIRCAPAWLIKSDGNSFSTRVVLDVGVAVWRSGCVPHFHSEIVSRCNRKTYVGLVARQARR